MSKLIVERVELPVFLNGSLVDLETTKVDDGSIICYGVITEAELIQVCAENQHELRRLFVRYFRHRFSDCKRLRRLEFFRLRTEEGRYGNVYHILMEMPHRIPVRCISCAWREFTGAYIVNIKWCYNWSYRIAVFGESRCGVG